MGVVLYGIGNDNFDFLIFGEWVNFIVVCNFGIKIEIFKVFVDDGRLEFMVIEIFMWSFVVVKFLY